jgi:citrate lyase subunit beta/citryl-CoA lyase
MLAKAATLPADQIFVDLEDAVAAAEKTDETRAQVVRALRDQVWAAATKAVRVNGVQSRWCLHDLLYVVPRAGAALDCIVIPKVETPAEIHFVDHLLTQLERDADRTAPLGLEVQIESPRGLVNLEAIAAASPRVESLVFGPGDFAASAGMLQLTVGGSDPDYDGDQWHFVLWRILTVARAFGLQAIDGPYAQIRDPDGFLVVARRARALGFDGKWALHPDQIGLCNDIFSPSREAFERAERILDAYRCATDENGLGAVMFEGEMIDEASRRMAEQVVLRGRATARAT